jgi:methionyl-tRNA synthetase
MYVWLDALTNYITAAGYPDAQSATFKTFWPADIHMVGKDILRFHAVYWPAFLMSAGVAPPKRVFAHGWWTNEGQKMSKTLRNALVPAELVQSYGLDQVRYFLLREVPFGNDGDFSHKAMVGRMNYDLANQFGNLAQRVLSMIAKNCEGQVPQPGDLAPEDEALLAAAKALLGDLRQEMDRQQFHSALIKTWEVVGEANRYIDHTAPWGLKETAEMRTRRATVLYVLAETIRRLAILCQPVMPDAMAKMLDQLAVDSGARSFADLESRLAPGTALPAPQGIFPRYVEEEETA